MSCNAKYSIRDGDPLPDVEVYRQTVESLQYACLTRLDISYSVNKLC